MKQLQALSLEELKLHKAEATAKKEELEKLKMAKDKSWDEAKQEELDELALILVDLDELIESKLAEVVPEAKAAYTPAKGTEKMVHLSIVQGRRFNAMTGKEESKPYIQLFTYPEWQLFKKHFRSLGYFIVAVLHDPYNEAEACVVKK